MEAVSLKRKPNWVESSVEQPVDVSVPKDIQPPALPAKHYDAETTEPISCGLCSLDELLSWSSSEANPLNVAAIPLVPREPRLVDCQRRTLVSHDMMGGYLDDRFIQGSNAEAPYAFYHWQYIDIFNYFTHHMVTVPPAVWTNAAHKHGVIVLGTFITEWTDGAAVCKTFLKDEKSYQEVANKLVQISQYYRFDGWLINIENALSETAVRNTASFLAYLTQQMHEHVPSSLILWYDSVLESGELKWQNELNRSNRMFFHACDGFFTNYNWTEENLEQMKVFSGMQGRQADVYVGVDVFARGKVVGGMLETNKALDVIRKHNFSVAIFAPGWVFETLSDKNQFRANQDEFWALLSDYLYIHRPASRLPFISSFCQGFGKALYWKGQHEMRKRWFNLTAQEIQPLYYQMDLGDKCWLRSSCCPEDVWKGGCSLLLVGLMPANLSSPICAKIFSLHVPLDSKILVVLVHKVSPGITISLQLQTTDVSYCSHTDAHEVTLSSTSPTEPHLAKLISELCGNRNPEGWTVGCSQLELHSCVLREVCVLIHQDAGAQDSHFTCRVGEIMVLDVDSLQPPSDPVEDLRIDDVVWLRGDAKSPEGASPRLRLSATLRWNYPLQSVRHFKVYWRRLRGPDPKTPHGQLELVAWAYSNQFRVTELVVPEPPCVLELVVEPVDRKGFPVPESLWGRREFSYSEEP
ncbi:cytosolic endo-beta-N-acetylglucosaminidase [Cyprinodon tularosa]|uniref:cytosolic endo-beta-N-acetylglucosaminidase n=1 Tax=Cyprinodon tularosa TaxID=77115 RepID=UPI0018E251CA|nr:cytosolic endo-beta-N-acetylglucosaminidase [Cyprinodon tularosa]